MKQTSIVSLCLCMLLLLSSQLAKSQTSPSTVKFTVTYNPATETYTALLIPDYSVPNSNNPLSSEFGSTAQFTLAVPRNFIITAITDVTGNWDNSPQKLGPGQPGQDFSAYGLNPTINYYAIGKSASETNYGQFTPGQPVALFTFKGNGCFGPIQPLAANDPFISAANDAYSLNVANSFYSRSGQPAGGNQEPLEQFISITGPPTTCLLASPDVASVVVGQAVTVPILANDRNANGTAVADLTKINPPTVGTPLKGVASVNPDGTVSYTANPGSSGTDVFSYTICDRTSSTICSASTITITIVPSVMASPDAGMASAGTGGIAIANVATNDVVNAQPATVGAGGNATIATIGTYPAGITLNPATGSVSVAVGTAPGSYTLVYQLCDKLATPTCATTTATVTVMPSVTATPDAGTVSTGTGGVGIANIATNDIVNGRPATLGAAGNATVASVGMYPVGITLNPATGSVSVAVGTVPGTYALLYQLCDKLTTPTCTTGLATITVTPSVVANPDAGTVSAGTGGAAVTNIVANDVVNGQPVTLGAGGNATVASVGAYPAGITLNPVAGSVSVAVGTVPGSYTLVYQLCDRLTTPTCTTGLLTITVTPSVTASPDAGTVSSGAGGTAVANVAANDRVNGAAAMLGTGGNATVASAGTYPAGITLNPATGSVSVAVGTTPGTYTLVYQLCDKLTTPTCATTTATITVTPSVTAAPDAGTVSAGTGGTAVLNVAANDVINGTPATVGTGGNATLAAVGTYPTGITLNPATGSVSVAVGTIPGTYVLVYQLCDKLTTPTCATTTATITVTPSVTASPDMGTVSSGIGGTAVASVAVNDLVNGRVATLGTGGNATVATVGTYPAGITLDPATGSLNVTLGTAPGTYTVVYQLCDKLTTPTCATTTATITVTPSVMATPDSGTVSAGTGGTAVANIAANDVVNGQPATLGTGGNATVAQVGSYPAGITLNPTTGSIRVAAGTTPDTYLLVYQLCDKLSTPTCTTTTATITVNPSLTASPDAGTVSAGTGGTAVASVVTNDVVNGQPATLGAAGNATIAALGTYPAGVMLDPNTGALTVAPNTGPGSYTLAYQLCDKLTPTTCTTATVALTITSSLTARPDAATVVGGAVVIIPVLANDSNPDGSPVVSLTFVSLSISTAPVKGTITINPDGTVSYSANIASTGTDTFVYTLCDRANPGMCTSATVTVSISANRSVVLSPKVYLQGALFGVAASNPLMRDDLRAKGLVPLMSPYPMLGLSGLTPVGGVSSSVLSTTGSDAIVDWVFVELRSGSDPTVVVDSRSALVQRDGDVVDVDGGSPLSFSVAQSGSYYVGVRHRNHLGVLTGAGVVLSFTATVVDFRRPSTSTYSLNANSLVNQAQVVVDQGVALWAGNALYDSNIIYQGPGNDVNVIAQQVINAPGNIFVTPFYKLRGYYSGDINLNGEVIFQGSGNDVDFIYQNIIKNHPGNTFKQNFFKIKEQLP